jgi:hypothetical protein
MRSDDCATRGAVIAPSEGGAGVFSRFERWLLDFLLAPSRGASAGLLRVGLGLVACWQSIGLWLNLERYWGAEGLVPWATVRSDRYRWLSPFFYAPDSTIVLHAHGVVFSIASVALLVGLAPRAAAVMLALTHVSLQLRNPFVLNSGDRLFMIQLALASLAPLGARFSIDAWWRGRSPSGTNGSSVLRVARSSFEGANRLGERLVALQIAYVYLSSALAKLSQERWRSGWMLRDVLASPVFAEHPRWIDSWPIVAALTYSTLLFELTFPLLVWHRRTRAWALVAGVLFHAGIELTMMIPIFSSVMIASYAAFLSDDEAERLFARLRSLRRRA